MPPRLPRATSSLLKAVALTGAAAFALFLTAAAERAAPNERNEHHLRNIRQITFGGQNAEAYFSHDGTRLIFQSTRDGRSCDQQFIMNIDGTKVRRISTGS